MTSVGIAFRNATESNMGQYVIFSAPDAIVGLSVAPSEDLRRAECQRLVHLATLRLLW